jgi:hypothetical protein
MLVSYFPIVYIMIFIIVILIPIFITICYFITKEISRKKSEKDLEHRRSILHQKNRKFLYFIPIAIFFVAWGVDIGVAIFYLLDQDISFLNWALNWPELTDHYLIYTNTFSTFFFGCYSWSIITYYLGTKNLKRFRKAIKYISLWYPFWFGISINLSIAGAESYYNNWLIVHVIFGIWATLGSIIAIIMALSIMFSKIDFKGELKFKISGKKFIKIRDFLDWNQAVILTLVIILIGTLDSIILWRSFPILAIISIFSIALTILLIFILNYFFLKKKDYYKDARQIKEELAVVTSEITPIRPPLEHCWNCGTKIENGQRYCRECFTKLI